MSSSFHLTFKIKHLKYMSVLPSRTSYNGNVLSLLCSPHTVAISHVWLEHLKCAVPGETKEGLTGERKLGTQCSKLPQVVHSGKQPSEKKAEGGMRA